MKIKSMAAYLTGIVLLSMLIHACQAEVMQDTRSFGSGDTAKPASKDEDAKPEEMTPEAPGETGTPPTPTPTPGAPATAPRFTMSWDASADTAVVSYKVFVVPPDRNPRFPGKTDIPVQIKNYPVASLQRNGQKYSVTVSSDEVKTALGATAANLTAYCFTVVAVNGVGNSAHSPLICP